MQHFPLTKDEAVKRGYQWIEVPRGEYAITKKHQNYQIQLMMLTTLYFKRSY